MRQQLGCSISVIFAGKNFIADELALLLPIHHHDWHVAINL